MTGLIPDGSSRLIFLVDIDCGDTLVGDKTRQGYARKRILKPAGYFFVEMPA